MRQDEVLHFSLSFSLDRTAGDKLEVNKDDIIWGIIFIFLIIVVLTTDVEAIHYDKYSKLSESELESLVAKKVTIQDGVPLNCQEEVIDQIMSFKIVSDKALYEFIDNNIEIDIVDYSKILGDDYAGSFSLKSLENIENMDNIASLSELVELINDSVTYQVIVDYRYIDYALLHEIGHYFYKSNNLESDNELNELIDGVGADVIHNELEDSEYFTSYSEFYAEVFKRYFKGELKNQELIKYFDTAFENQ